MDVRVPFTGFDPYKLTGVRVTDRELGHGSYATILELEYMGLKCAGKKIHELLLRQGDASYAVRRFDEECRLLSKVRHPNIVQFLGVHFQQGERAPILVMEFLPTNLTSCIEQYGILPKEISYSILHDVALGLCYLHGQTPPIIHRDLSSNNVLLTPNMTGKISDLGVARILNLTPQQVRRMTGIPGTPAYMPPEVMVTNPKYDTRVDKFSYGIIMIHIFSGKWPEPQVGQRQEMLLKAFKNDHPLKDLVHRCISDNPLLRPHTSDIAKQISEVASHFPASFANRLEILRRLEAVQEEKRALAEEGERIHTALMDKINTTIMEKDATISAMSEQLTKARENLSTKQQAPQASITWKLCAELPTGLSAGVNTIINNKVYCGGRAADENDIHIIYCYDPLQHKWTRLPPLPVEWFGLGQVNGKLVAVGGMKRGEAPSNEVYTCKHMNDERSQKWKQKIPPMPTARYSPGVLSLKSALVVAGGFTSSYYTDAVEVFKSDTSQWYRTHSLPTVCCNISLVAIGNTCCALGGYQHPSPLNQALYASIDDLVCNAVPANQTTHSGNSDTQSAWKALPNTPADAPAAAVLAGNLLAVGGKDTSDRGAAKKEVYMYSHSTNSWIYISDLPAPRSTTTVAVLSSTEFLVIGGRDGIRMNSVYKGTLTLL